MTRAATLLFALGCAAASPLRDAWLQYAPVAPGSLGVDVRAIACGNHSGGTAVSPLANACAELSVALGAMLGHPVPLLPAVPATATAAAAAAGTLTVRLDGSYTGGGSAPAGGSGPAETASAAETSTFHVGSVPADESSVLAAAESSSACLALSGPTGRAVLFGAFRFLAALQRASVAHPLLEALPLRSAPAAPIRSWNVWDNLIGPTEYQFNLNDTAGERIPGSIFHWGELPGALRPAYDGFARLLASTGVNAIVLNNINACDHPENARLLATPYLRKAGALAAVFAARGLAVLLSPCFASPMTVGNCSTADPLAPAVAAWWRAKAAEAAALLPGFGGFLVKADSEHEPGPSVYNRSVPDAANMLGAALAPQRALLIWRSFKHPGQWSSNGTEDQARFLYDTFVPLDGLFAPNVVLQTKVGPFDFQAHEPVQALLGAMRNTPVIVEVEVSQTFTGQALHACYLPSQWAHYLGTETAKYAPRGWPLSRVISAGPSCALCGMAGVNNLFETEGWSTSPLGQANAHGFGRLAWTPSLHASDAAEEWAALTWPRAPRAAAAAAAILLRSWAAFENYTSPLGLGYIVEAVRHYWMDPDGWKGKTHPPNNGYGGGFNASSTRVGYNRSVSYGSLYADAAFASALREPATTPRRLLLSFHNLPFDAPIGGGVAGEGGAGAPSLLQLLYATLRAGVGAAEDFVRQWAAVEADLPGDARFGIIDAQLKIAATDARNFSATLTRWFANVSGTPPQPGSRGLPASAPTMQLFHWNMHWQCSALSDCRTKALALVQSKLNASFDLVSLVELENFSALPLSPDHGLLMNVIAQNPASRLDDAALLWYNTKRFLKVDGGPIFFGGVTSNGTAPAAGQGFYVGNWAILQRVSGTRKCLVLQGHFSHDLKQSVAAVREAVPALSAIIQGSMDIVVLADTNDWAQTATNIKAAFGWTDADPAPMPMTDLTGSTCCWEAKGCAAGVGCCWGKQNPYDKFLVRLERAEDAAQTVEIGQDLTSAGLGDDVLAGWGCGGTPGAGEMHKPVQVAIKLAPAAAR
jgi:alpha-glucuronidase